MNETTGNETMNAIQELPPINEISATVLGNASAKDGDFRRQLLNNPKQVIQDISTQSVPQDINIRVAQNTEDTVHIPVPSYKELENNTAHVSDQDLQNISGGEIIGSALVIFGFGATVITGAVAATAAIVLTRSTS